MGAVTCYLKSFSSDFSNSVLHIRLHVGTVRHGAHQHIQRPPTNAKLHNGQQPPYASRSHSGAHLVLCPQTLCLVKPELNSLSAVICLNCSLMQPPFHSQVCVMN